MCTCFCDDVRAAKHDLCVVLCAMCWAPISPATSHRDCWIKSPRVSIQSSMLFAMYAFWLGPVLDARTFR